MAIQLSTGLRDSMLSGGSLSEALNGGKIHIYGGPVPPSADSAQSATILCTITAGGAGGGLNFATTPVGGALSKDAAQEWRGTNLLGGTATHYRFVAIGDTGAASVAEARVQGLVGVVGQQMNLSSVDLVAGASTPLDYYVLSLPG